MKFKKEPYGKWHLTRIIHQEIRSWTIPPENVRDVEQAIWSSMQSTNLFLSALHPVIIFKQLECLKIIKHHDITLIYLKEGFEKPGILVNPECFRGEWFQNLPKTFGKNSDKSTVLQSPLKEMWNIRVRLPGKARYSTYLFIGILWEIR